jgi:hypothetical protein
VLVLLKQVCGDDDATPPLRYEVLVVFEQFRMLNRLLRPLLLGVHCRRKHKKPSRVACFGLVQTKNKNYVKRCVSNVCIVPGCDAGVSINRRSTLRQFFNISGVLSQQCKQPMFVHFDANATYRTVLQRM